MAALRFFFSLFMIPVSILVAAAGIMAFSAAGTDPNTSELITTAGLFMPVILFVNLLIAVYWICIKKWWVVIPIATLLLNIGYLTSIFQISFSSPEVPAKAIPLRVATYNVGNFRSWAKQDTHHPVCYFLCDAGVDIVCFQEYTDHSKLDADSLGKLLNLPYHAVKYTSGSQNNGSAIFSKYPITASGKLPFDSKINDAIWADIQVGNQTIRVIGCHLETTAFSSKRKELNKQDLTDAEPQQIVSIYSDITTALYENSCRRANQANLVRQLIDSTSCPVIVCGDFNDPPSTYTYHRVKGDLEDSFRSRGKGYGYTFRGLHRLFRIDYILYSLSFNCIAYNSKDQEWSDHNPIICDLYL